MNLLEGMHGTVAILLICAVLFVEEAGVPLPLVPGDALVIAAGVLIANGSVSPWIFLPAAFIAVLGGTLTAYTWSATFGVAAVGAVAQRVGAGKALARASAHLQRTGPVRIGVARLIPGLRVYTAIVSGAAGVNLRIFLLGAVPAILIWLLFFTVLGLLVGVPALASLSHVQHLAVTGAGLLAIGAATFLGVRRMPGGDMAASTLLRLPRAWLVTLSAIVDLTITTSVVSGTVEILREGFGFDDPDGIIDLALVLALIVLLYVGLARRLVGATAGERLLGVRYPAH